MASIFLCAVGASAGSPAEPAWLARSAPAHLEHVHRAFHVGMSMLCRASMQALAGSTRTSGTTWHRANYELLRARRLSRGAVYPPSPREAAGVNVGRAVRTLLRLSWCSGAATAVTSPILPGHPQHGGGGHVADLNTVAGKVANEGR